MTIHLRVIIFEFVVYLIVFPWVISHEPLGRQGFKGHHVHVMRRVQEKNIFYKYLYKYFFFYVFFFYTRTQNLKRILFLFQFDFKVWDKCQSTLYPLSHTLISHGLSRLKTVQYSSDFHKLFLKQENHRSGLTLGIIDKGHCVRPAGVCEEGTVAQGRTRTEELNEGKKETWWRELLHASLPSWRDWCEEKCLGGEESAPSLGGASS